MTRRAPPGDLPGRAHDEMIPVTGDASFEASILGIERVRTRLEEFPLSGMALSADGADLAEAGRDGSVISMAGRALGSGEVAFLEEQFSMDTLSKPLEIMWMYMSMRMHFIRIHS